MPQYEDDEGMDDSFVHTDIPDSFRELRACMVCSLVKTFTQFYNTGCENCALLEMADNRQRVAECTSAHFEGMIAMMHPRESWVAKWQRIVRFMPGIYAVSVYGDLPDPIKRYLEDRNVACRVQSL